MAIRLNLIILVAVAVCIVILGLFVVSVIQTKKRAGEHCKKKADRDNKVESSDQQVAETCDHDKSSEKGCHASTKQAKQWSKPATRTPAPIHVIRTPTPIHETLPPAPIQATGTPAPIQATGTPAPIQATRTPAPIRATKTPTPIHETLPPAATQASNQTSADISGHKSDKATETRRETKENAKICVVDLQLPSGKYKEVGSEVIASINRHEAMVLQLYMTWYKTTPNTGAITFLVYPPWKDCRVQLVVKDNHLDEHATKLQIEVAERNTNQVVLDLTADADNFIQSLDCSSDACPEGASLLNKIQVVVENIKKCADEFARQTDEPVDTTKNAEEIMAKVQWLRLLKIYPKSAMLRLMHTVNDGIICPRQLEYFGRGKPINQTFREHNSIVQGLRTKIAENGRRINEAQLVVVFKFIVERSISTLLFDDSSDLHEQLLRKMKNIAEKLETSESMFKLLKDELSFPYAGSIAAKLSEDIQEISETWDTMEVEKVLRNLHGAYIEKRPTESHLFV